MADIFGKKSSGQTPNNSTNPNPYPPSGFGNYGNTSGYNGGFNNGGFNNGGFNNGGFNNGGFNNGGFNNGGFNNGGFTGTGFSTGLGGGGPKQTISSVHFSWSFLIFSIIAAVVFFLIGELIYSTLICKVNSILFMGLYFAVFGFILWLFLFIAARINHLKFSLKSLIIPAVCFLLLFGFGALFEFLYELDFSTAPLPADNYIFMMDNSGSMDTNDHEQKRVSALKQIMNNKEESFEFAIYTFGDEVACIREMAPLSEGIGDITISPSGSTPMLETLELILTDMESGKLPYNSGTQVILLTDGIASDTDLLGIKLKNILKDFRNKNVSISTVGLGQVDKAFLSDVSSGTGGLSIVVDDVDQLESAMTSVIRSTTASRDLLSVRTNTSNSWVRGLLRVLFLTFLGCLLLGIKLAVTDDSAHAAMIIISSIAASILASLIVEIGLNLFLTGFVARIILVLLFSLMLTTLEKIVEIGYGTGKLSRL